MGALIRPIRFGKRGEFLLKTVTAALTACFLGVFAAVSPALGAVGFYAVGHIENGDFKQTNGGAGFATGWTHIVPVGNQVIFYRAGDGIYAVGHIENGDFKQTHAGAGFATGWTHIVPVGNQVIFYRAGDGIYAVGHIENGDFKPTHAGAGFATGWTHIVPVGNQVIFYRAGDGIYAVGHIENGDFKQTHAGAGFATGWTHIVPVGNQVIFYRAGDGIYAVGHIENGDFKQTHAGAGFATGWAHIVPVGNQVIFYRAGDGIYAVGHIENGDFKQTHAGAGFATGWAHIVPVGNQVIFYRAGDGIYAVGHIENGDFKPTHAGAGFDTGWTHIVPVGNQVIFYRTDLTAPVHRLKVSRYTTSSLTNDDADQILSDASTVLQTNDGPDDVTCPVTLIRDGDVSVFTNGDGSIDSRAEFNTVIGLSGWVKVVNQINWCDKIKPNIIGCSPVPGNSLVVIRHTPNLEGILWAHEFGHDKGLNHRDDDPNAVMNGTIGSTRRRVTADECTAYKTGGTAAAVVMAGGTPPAGGRAQMDLREFVRQVFIHGVPYDEATQYGSAAVPTLLDMLRNPAEAEYWTNIVVVLGMIGDERAVEPLISFIEASGQDRLSPQYYRAKTSALMSLGYIINKTNSQRALSYLRDSVRPETWASRSVTGIAPFQTSMAERNFDFSKHAILGLALSGRPEAAQFLRSLQQPATTDTQRAFQAKVSDVVAEAITENEKISREGLASYYRSNRR